MFAAARPARSGAVSLKLVLLTLVLAAMAVGLYVVGRYAWASYRYSQALSAIDRKDFAEARRHLDYCMRERPDSGEIWFLAARTARRSGALDESVQLLKEAEKKGWVKEAIELERALYEVQTGHHRAMAPRLIDAVEKNHPDSIMILEILTGAAIRKFELDLAIRCLELWVKLEPDSAQVRLWRGDLYERMLALPDAAQEYEHLLKVKPDNVEARRKYANILVHQKDLPGAESQYKWLLERFPEDPGLRRGYAHCLAEMGRVEEARAILKQLLEIRDDGLTNLILGQIEYSDGNFVGAESHLKRAYQRMPAEPAVMYKLLNCYHNNKKVKEAAELDKRLQQFEKDRDLARKHMADIMRKPQDPEPRLLLANCLTRCGMPDEGKRWLETGLQLDPYHKESNEAMADYYAGIGDVKMSEQYKKLAAMARPSKPAP